MIREDSKMANEKNIKDSIEVLKRVRDRQGKFNLIEWQEGANFIASIENEEYLYTCNMAACIGGYIAVSHEFHAEGGRPMCGMPVFRRLVGFEAMAEYWGVDVREVEMRCDCDQFTLAYYGVYHIDDITIDMAIAAVESLLNLSE